MPVNIFNIFLHVMAFVINGIKYCLTEISHTSTCSYRSSLGTLEYGIVGGPTLDEGIDAPTKVFIPYKREESIVMHQMNPPSDRWVS
jgi:hypothetical protein